MSARDRAPEEQPGQSLPPDPRETCGGAVSGAGHQPTTGLAPTIRAAHVPGITQSLIVPGHELAPGQHIDDFELLEILGEGSFGKVFLARQISLDRQVALKVTANRGSEARTLARLEHDHIVSVFSETVVAERELRLLCMQYVPGTTLNRIIAVLQQRGREEWSGRAIVNAIDNLSTHPASFHPAALRDRELLAKADFVEAVCWIGARLAEALDYAHGQGILHRDIKPANILVTPYGRPLLADFNMAFYLDPAAGEHAMFGGTFAYMSPEHLDAFNRETATPRRLVDQRSDIYSLGVVLFELMTGQQPFEPIPQGVRLAEGLRAAAAVRRTGAPAVRRLNPGIPELLDGVIRRCLDPQPEHRCQAAAELARALDGCRAHRTTERQLPRPGPLTRAALRRPFLWLVILAFLPHALGSLVNISYNSLEIVGHLRPDQQSVFGQLVLVYNLVAYPACLAVLIGLAVPAIRVWRQRSARRLPDKAPLAAVRRRMLAWPAWTVGLSCVGWLPGGLLFPLVIHLRSGPVSPTVFGHFALSFALSGLIALTYSYLAVQFVVLRVLYPALWADPAGLRETMIQELGCREGRLRLFPVLAGVIPLSGAVLLVTSGPEIVGGQGFRLLVTTLIVIGMAGFALAVLVDRLTEHTLAALTGSKLGTSDPSSP